MSIQPASLQVNRARRLSTLRHRLQILAALLLLALVAVSAPAVAKQPEPSPAPEATPKAEKATVYAAYLKDPASLGFSPDAHLFDEVYGQIKTLHVENDPDARLFEGVAAEVRRLLEEAHVDAAGLAALRRDRSLPTEIAHRYADQVPAGVLWYAMVRGLFVGTDDRHSVLMTPREFKTLLEMLQDQTFGGVGIFVEIDRDNKNQLTVIEPVEGTPAHRAGIAPGDQIMAIDGKSTAGISIDIASTQLRGKVGTKVVLTIKRGPQTFDVPIERAQIQVPSVSHKMLPGKVGYIRLRVYGDRTSGEFSDALAELERGGAQSLIVDVRNNGGGYLNAAVELCSHFIPSGDVVTYLTNRQGTRRTYNGGPLHRSRLPLVLLVNGFSASASEITAGCLKDYGVATIMGAKTFGKGSVQQIFKLQDGAAFKLTIAYFFTPHGNKINKVGVEPDVKVDMEPRLVGHRDKDVQLQKAVEFLTRKTSQRP